MPQPAIRIETGLLQKALLYAVFSVRFSENRVFFTENCLLKTENLDLAKVLLKLEHTGFSQASVTFLRCFRVRTRQLLDKGSRRFLPLKGCLPGGIMTSVYRKLSRTHYCLVRNWNGYERNDRNVSPGQNTLWHLGQ